jgi:hypothetical protein
MPELPNALAGSHTPHPQTFNTTNLLVTSRRILSIEQDFADALRLEICASDEDILRYLEGRIGKKDRLKRLIKADLNLQNSLIDTIVENTKGM